MSTIGGFDHIENKHTLYRGKSYMKKFRTSLMKMQKYVTFVEKKILKKLSKSINYCIEAIPVIFHNGSNYDYHFIVKELANEFERQFECLGENKEKYKTITFPIKKETTKIDKDRKCRQYILQNKIY